MKLWPFPCRNCQKCSPNWEIKSGEPGTRRENNSGCKELRNLLTTLTTKYDRIVLFSGTETYKEFPILRCILSKQKILKDTCFYLSIHKNEKAFYLLLTLQAGMTWVGTITRFSLQN